MAQKADREREHILAERLEQNISNGPATSPMDFHHDTTGAFQNEANSTIRKSSTANINTAKTFTDKDHAALLMLAYSGIQEDVKALNAADFALELAHTKVGMQGKLDFDTLCKAPKNARFVFDRQEAANPATTPDDTLDSDVAAGGNHDPKGSNFVASSEAPTTLVSLPTISARNLLIDDSSRALKTGKVNEDGLKKLRRAFWVVGKCRIDHFGKDQTHRHWPTELHRVANQHEDPHKQNYPRHTTVMWRLRDGFEKYEEQCQKRQATQIAHHYFDDVDTNSRNSHNRINRMTRRYFNLYFGHLFTMSNKRDWRPVLHMRYMEIMCEALQRTQDSILTELASLELWKEVAADDTAIQGDDIARLGEVIMGRSVRDSEGLAELLKTDLDGNGRMTGEELIDFNCKRLISHLSVTQWGNIPGMLNLLSQRLRCKNSLNLQVRHGDTLTQSRHQLESIDNDLEDLLQQESDLADIVEETVGKYGNGNSKMLQLAEECQKYGINWGLDSSIDGEGFEWDYDYGNELFRALAERKLMHKNAEKRLHDGIYDKISN